ncbi:MAG: hypothetical protein Q4E13_00180 [Clostridia bacterium]|nr:hypothetical protein [Clostridia bacterium]
MKKNELIRLGREILRVLEFDESRALVINCTHKFMPKWMNQEELVGFESYSDETPPETVSLESLSPADKRIAHERYTLIAGILPFVGDERQRSAVIARISEDRKVSKQTLRKYLCLYLAYQDIAVLAPKHPSKDTPLTQDEKNMRWALNKFFYTRQRNSLATAYTLMLKERYCDSTGNLLPHRPTLYQFRYFYRKHRKLETYYISRDGLKHYQRNNRPLLGSGVQEFAPSVGVGMLDSTICDIYLTDNAGNLVGRPILTACVDAYSGLCCGYSLSWEGGVYSLRSLMANVIADKTAWANRFGISIRQEDWNCNQLPATLVTDMGAEYKSETFEQIAELGVTVINLPAYRPELKGVVEKFFDVVQNLYKKHLKGKGVIEPDFQERGARDYRKDACLTMRDFEQIILHCILYYNSKRVIENFPFSEEMLSQKVAPISSQIWNWGTAKLGANLISVDHDALMRTLLPRTTGRFSRRGLIVNKLRYKRDGYTERYLQGGIATVAYNPDDASTVWLAENGKYIRFDLVESRFTNMGVEEIQTIKEGQRALEHSFRDASLQAQIDLASHIEAIASGADFSSNANIKAIRHTRRKEQIRTHMNFMEGTNHENHF